MGLFSTSSSVSFDPSVDIPSLSGKVILVTGGNSGLGKQSIVELAKHHPAQIWLAARSLVKGNEAASDIRNQVPGVNIKVLELDLGSVKSIQHAATVFCQDSPRLDILLLNAGAMALPPGVTADGYEIQFGTNHLGHALLTKLLLPVLLQTAGRDVGSDVRIVVLSSAGHTVVPNGGIQFDTLKSSAEKMGTLNRYGQSKLANILFSSELAKRYPQFKVVAVHPGIVDTNLSNTMVQHSILMRAMMKVVKPTIEVSVTEGVKNQLWACTADKIASGAYYEPVGVAGKESRYAKDPELAKEL